MKPVEIRDFVGLITNAGELSAPTGSSDEQVNVGTLSEGELSVRKGLREISFEN